MIGKVRKLRGIVRAPALLRALVRYGVAAGVEHCAVLRSLGEVGTLVDVGANRGQFALAARHVWPRVRIYSFEPLEKPAGVYRAVFRGDPDVALYRVAIGPRAGEAEIHLSRRDDSSSLLPITKTQERLFPGTGAVGRAVIKTRRLDEMLRRSDIAAPALLKLDVQGFELEALRGCNALLDAFKWVYCELSFMELYEGQALAGEAISWLHERGFGLRGVYNPAYAPDGRAVQADFLFGRT